MKQVNPNDDYLERSPRELKILRAVTIALNVLFAALCIFALYLVK